MFIVLIEPACRSYFAVRGICVFFAEAVCANGVIKDNCFTVFTECGCLLSGMSSFDTRGMLKVFPLIFLRVILE